MAARQLGLDPGLLRQQPVERLIELVDGDGAQAQERAQRGARGRLVERARGGELGGRIDEPRHDHGERQPTGARRSAWDQVGGLDAGVETEAPGDAEHGGDMAVRQGAQDLESVAGGRQRLIAQHGTQCRDLFGRPLGQIGEGAVPDLAAVAVGLAQENGGG